MKVELVRFTEGPEEAIAEAARISHLASRDGREDDRQLIRNLKKWGHMSPFEFADATFFLEGISRSCLAQITRHRLCSFMVRSMRYVEQKENEIVVPNSVKETNQENTFLAVQDEAFESYKKMREAGVPKEDARYALPIGSETSMYIKSNFREYRHIIGLRGERAAQWEIRELADAFLEQLLEIAPTVFEDLKVEIDK